MPEALARSHNDSILSRTARSASGRARRGPLRRIVGRLMALPARTMAGAVLAAVVAGIIINALALQKERHPAPFFAAPKASPQVVAAPEAPVAAPANTPAIAALPPARPAKLGAEPDVTPTARIADPIRDLLRDDGGKDAQRLTLAAQNALIKMGYAVKADGVAGASTLQAITQFERAHSLTVSSDITPRLVKQLVAAANPPAR